MDNKLAAFYASIKKLVTDFMAYCDRAIKKVEESKGAGTLVVTLDRDNGVASHDATQIFEYVQNGGTVRLFDDYEDWIVYYELRMVDGDGTAMFGATLEGSELIISVDDGATFYEFCNDFVDLTAKYTGTFFVNDEHYHFYDSNIFSEWCNSNYNTGGFVIKNGKLYDKNDNLVKFHALDEVGCGINTAINEGHRYIT